MTAPFVVLALPRSRTFWLSKFLSYDGWTCGHDEIRHARCLEDVRTWLAWPRTGTAETAAAPFWRLLRRLAPHTNVVVVRRDPGAVFRSLLRLPYPMDAAYVARELRRQDRALDQVAARWPGALSVAFEDLEHEDVCARLFEHCLPYRHDSAWWASLAPRNLQADVMAVVQDVQANAPLLDRMRRDWRGDYMIQLETINGTTFGHVTVTRWSAQIARQVRADADAVMALYGGPIYATTDHPHDGDYTKFRKFLVLMGFAFETTVRGTGQSVYLRRS